MEGGSGGGAALDCEEFIFNLVQRQDSSGAGKTNKTLCEEYFSAITTNVPSLLTNDTWQNDFVTTDAMQDSSELAEDVFDVTETSQTATDVIETLEALPNFGSGFDSETTTGLWEDVINIEKDSESLGSGYGMPAAAATTPEVTTAVALEEAATDPPGIWSLGDLGDFSTPTVDIFTTMAGGETDPFTDSYNKTLISTITKMTEALGKNVTDLKSPEISKVNLSLCEWYLPTMQQTPLALGNTGIALWVLGFLITFCLIGMFAKQAYFIYKTSHKVFRRHLYSITSIYVVMALLTSIGSGIPRAHAVCSGMKDVYMSIGIGHFVDLTIAMYGGENVMFWYVKDRVINIKVIPICKCCFCIPICKTKRVSVSILKWLVWQMKWSQAVYYLLKLIWMKSLENSIGVVSPHNSSFWYMHILNVFSFLSGVMSLIIIGALVQEDLQQKYNYSIKTKLVRFTILTTKLQRLLFEILEASNVFPCYPPYVSQKFYKNVLKDFIYLLEVFFLGGITFFVYNKRGEFEHANSKEIPQPMLDKASDEQQDENGFPVAEEFKVPLNSKLTDDSNC